jgi:mannan endo-1,4-beta-mannosidase
MVDVIGFDCYQYSSDEAYTDEMKRALDIISSFGKDHDKILAVTETGFEGVKNPQWWTRVLYPAIQDYPVSYVLVWRNACDMDTHFYAPFKGHESAGDFKEFSGFDNMKFL